MGALGGAGQWGRGECNVDWEPYTYLELFMDMAPDIEALERRVGQGTGFSVKLKGDAVNVSGITFRYTYDPVRLTLNSTVFEGVWLGNCTSLSVTAGTVAYRCTLAPGDWDADGGAIATSVSRRMR